jgi:hypothetical protein
MSPTDRTPEIVDPPSRAMTRSRPPIITAVRIDPPTVKNGEDLHLVVTARSRWRVQAELVELDSTKGSIGLRGRRQQPDELARQTGLEAGTLRRYQAAARLQALGIGPELAQALIEDGAIAGPAALGRATEEALAGALERAITRGALDRATDVARTADDLAARGRRAVDALLVAFVADRVRRANTCTDDCPADDSAFGCPAYVLDLIKAAGYTTAAELRQQFGWNVAGAGSEPVRRTRLCIDILRPTVQVSPQHATQKQYDQALNSALIGLTQQTRRELSADRLYQAALASPSVQEQNDQLQQVLRAAGRGEAVDGALAALEPLQLQALVEQSGQTAEQLRDRYFISFAPQECQARSACEHAALALQAYLTKRLETAQGDGRPPLLNYDDWRNEKGKQYYPENTYAFQLKQPLIRGKRELLRQHLQVARGILETVRLTDGREPSPEDASALLSSFRNRNPYYQNLKAGRRRDRGRRRLHDGRREALPAAADLLRQAEDPAPEALRWGESGVRAGGRAGECAGRREGGAGAGQWWQGPGGDEEGRRGARQRGQGAGAGDRRCPGRARDRGEPAQRAGDTRADRRRTAVAHPGGAGDQPRAGLGVPQWHLDLRPVVAVQAAGVHASPLHRPGEVRPAAAPLAIRVGAPGQAG